MLETGERIYTGLRHKNERTVQVFALSLTHHEIAPTLLEILRSTKPLFYEIIQIKNHKQIPRPVDLRLSYKELKVQFESSVLITIILFYLGNIRIDGK